MKMLLLTLLILATCGAYAADHQVTVYRGFFIAQAGIGAAYGLKRETQRAWLVLDWKETVAAGAGWECLSRVTMVVPDATGEVAIQTYTCEDHAEGERPAFALVPQTAGKRAILASKQSGESWQALMLAGSGSDLTVAGQAYPETPLRLRGRFLAVTRGEAPTAASTRFSFTFDRAMTTTAIASADAYEQALAEAVEAAANLHL